MSDDFTALDPDEGPTVWARKLDSNKYTVEIVEGTDPENSTNSYQLSHGEIDRLARLIQ